MLTKHAAIVLRVIKYNEKTDIADLLTREGKVSFLIPASRSHKSKVRRNLFQPLSVLEIEADIRQRRELHRIKELRLLLPVANISSNPFKTAMAFFIAEFLGRIMKPEDDCGTFFDYVLSSIEWLDGAGSGYANFHLVFLVKVSRFLGLQPSMRGYADGMCFDLQSSCFVDASVPLPYMLTADETKAFRTIMRLNYSDMHLFKMSREQRNRCMELLLMYYTIHITDLSDMKSVSVLKSLFV